MTKNEMCRISRRVDAACEQIKIKGLGWCTTIGRLENGWWYMRVSFFYDKEYVSIPCSHFDDNSKKIKQVIDKLKKGDLSIFNIKQDENKKVENT